MSPVQKVSLSLLIAVLVFSAFAVLAWSGLFDTIETTFYSARVRESIVDTLANASRVVRTYHATNSERFSAILNEEAVRNAYLVNQSQNDIAARENFFGRLEEEIPSLLFVRFLDLEGQELHYSTLPSDYRQQGQSREYSRPSEVFDTVDPDQIVLSPDSQADIVLLAGRNAFVYRFLVIDSFNITRGTALFYVGTTGVGRALVRESLIQMGEEVRIVPNGVTVVNYPVAFGHGFGETIGSVLSQSSDTSSVPRVQSDSGAGFLLFQREIDPGGRVVYVAPESVTQMTDVMKIVLLVSVFLTTFLLIFLLLNLRQDAVVVLSDRVKRFQINLLREYMESKEDIDWERWQLEFEQRREEVNREIRRGIGKVKGSKAEEVDRLINKSWDEILSVIGSRRVSSQPGGVDLERLESIIERVVSNFQNVPETRAAPVLENLNSTQSMPPQAETIEEAEPVEEFEDAEPADDVEEFEDAEPADDVEEVEDAEPVEEVDEAEEAEEAEPVEEIEDAESVDEVEEVEEVDEAEPADEAGEAPEAVDEVEPAEDVEEAEEVEEVEGIDEVEPAEDVEEAPEAVDEAEPAEDVNEVETLSEIDLAVPASVEDEFGVVVRNDGVYVPDDLDFDEIEMSEAFDGLEEDVDEEDEEPRYPATELEPIEELEAIEDLEELPAEVEDVGELESIDEEVIAELEEAEVGSDDQVEADVLPATADFSLGTYFSFGRKPGEVVDNVYQRPDVQRIEALGRSAAIPEAGALDEDDGRPPGSEYEGDEATLVEPLDGGAGVTDEPDLETLSIAEVLESLRGSGIIMDTGGVVQIAQNAYSETMSGEDTSIRELVDSVTRGTEPEGDDSDSQGIDDLLGIGSVELFDDEFLSGDDSLDEGIGEEHEGSDQRSLVFQQAGLDYDIFLRRYRSNESGIVKSLVEFTRLWRARVGCILTAEAEGLTPAYYLGFDEQCMESFILGDGPGPFPQLFKDRQLVLVNQPLSEIRYFNRLCPTHQLSAVRRAVFIPSVFKRRPAYCLLGVGQGVTNLKDYVLKTLSAEDASRVR